jgi:hypothetical protein
MKPLGHTTTCTRCEQEMPVPAHLVGMHTRLTHNECFPDDALHEGEKQYLDYLGECDDPELYRKTVALLKSIRMEMARRSHRCMDSDSFEGKFGITIYTPCLEPGKRCNMPNGMTVWSCDRHMRSFMTLVEVQP